MRNIIFAILLASLAGIVLVRYAHKEPLPGAHHEFDNPHADAARAMASGDFSLRAIPRFTLIVPGINADYGLLTTKYTIMTLKVPAPGFAVIDPKTHIDFVYEYAASYNRLVFDKLGCNYKKPMDKCKNYP